MIGRLLHEERGMALGLAIIVVVIVGVMGAGLLTLVATDLQAVMQFNRGEQAFELAEAGIEVAKAHLANDPSQADWASGNSTWPAWMKAPSQLLSNTTIRAQPS